MFKMTALAAALAGLAGPALADQAETKGGLTVKTDDGRFEFKLGGRFHIDTYAFDNCENTSAGGVKSDCGSAETVGGMFLRRGYVTATGKLYGWKFKQEFDLAADPAAQKTWREAWVSTDVGSGELIIGQFKPFRSMEELTSSNEILMMERPYATASGLFAGRQFQMGVGYKLPLDLGISGLWATDLHNLHQIGNAPSQGTGYSTRLTLLPLESDGLITHVGFSYGVDDYTVASKGPAPSAVKVTLAGRDSSTAQVVSPTATIGTPAADETQSTYGVELASTFGPGFVQAEYASSKLGQAAGTADQTVVTYYVQGSYFLTGESKVYKKDRGTYGSPKPFNSYGAWELTGRYDTIKNDDAATQPEVTQITLGTNWYVNPNVRFMLNYSMGELQNKDTSKKEVDAIALRTQLSF